MVSSRTSTFSSVVGSGVGTDDVSHWQSLLATFIVDSASALGHPYFYLLRTNTKWSLCLLSGLSPIHYSSLLLELAADEKGDKTMIAWVKPREIAAL